MRTHTGLEDCSSLPGLTSDSGWGEKDKPTEKTWNVEVGFSSSCATYLSYHFSFRSSSSLYTSYRLH